jgi:hypothetical protein
MERTPRSIVHGAGARVKTVFMKSRQDPAVAAAKQKMFAASAPARAAEEASFRAKYAGGQRKTGAAYPAEEEGFEDEDSSDWFYGFIFLVFLVFILSPGVLLTIPPGRGGLFMSGKTSIIAALVHALILATIASSI